MGDGHEPIRVLHVDDDPQFSELTETFLEREDDRFDIAAAADVSEGETYLAENDVDCIVSDYDLPGRSGIDFLETVRRDEPELPFVLYTGTGSEAVASDAISAGVTDYLQKESGTGQLSLLANRIANAVEAYRSHQLLTTRTRRLETLISNLPGMVYRSRNDPDWPMETVDGEVESLTGYSAHAIEHNEVRWGGEVIHPDDRTETWDAVQESLSADGTFEVTYRIVAADGTTKWMWERGRGIYADDGNLEALEGFITDITERRRQKAQLERTTARLEALFENSPDMINIHDMDGTIVEPNPRLCERTGYDASELTEMTIWDLDQAIGPAEAREIWTEMERGDQRRVTGEYRRKDGSTFPVEIHFRRLGLDDDDWFVAISRDITERAERQRELERSQKRLRHTERLANTGGWEMDADTGELRWTDGIYAIHDLDPASEFTPTLESALAFYHPADRETIERAVNRCLEEGEPYDEELRLITDEGRVRWIRTTGEPAADGADTVSMRGAVRDITERTERQHELERTNALLSTLIETFPVGVLAEDADRNILTVNERLFELFDLSGSPEDSRGESCEEMAEAVSGLFVDADGFVDRIDELVTEQRAIDDEELSLCDGRTFARSYRPIELPDGEGHLWVYRDITDRKNRERELQRAREEYEALINGMNDTAWVIDTDETILAVNDAAVETMGYSREELRSMTPHEFDVGLEADELSDLITNMPSDGIQIFETVHETKDGERIPVEISSSQIPYHGDTVVLSIARDVTDRKQREERLERFASIVSHDLRNPLNVAQGRLELARDECDSEQLDQVDRAHERMTILIDDLLTLARDGDRIGELEAVDLEAASKTCWETVETGNATVQIDTDRAIRADSSRLAQLFENLFRNAVEHGGDDVSVTVGDRPDGFYVADDGPGIPESKREDVFDVGYSTAEEGTGFGLSIVEQVADAHGWTVRLSDGDRGGARFDIVGLGSPD